MQACQVCGPSSILGYSTSIRSAFERKRAYKARCRELEETVAQKNQQIRRLNEAFRTGISEMHSLMRRRDLAIENQREDLRALRSELRDRTVSEAHRVRDRLAAELKNYLEHGEGGEIDMSRVKKIKSAIDLLSEEL